MPQWDGYQQVRARRDVALVEYGVDEARPGAHRDVTGFHMQRRPRHGRTHDLDVGACQAAAVRVVDLDDEPGVVGHRPSLPVGWARPARQGGEELLLMVRR